MYHRAKRFGINLVGEKDIVIAWIETQIKNGTFSLVEGEHIWSVGEGKHASVRAKIYFPTDVTLKYVCESFEKHPDIFYISHIVYLSCLGKCT